MTDMSRFLLTALIKFCIASCSRSRSAGVNSLGRPARSVANLARLLRGFLLVILDLLCHLVPRYDETLDQQVPGLLG